MADAPADAMADLSLTAPADAQHVTELRHTLRDWLKSQQLPETLVADILLAANEALTNVVDHAYPDNQGPFSLSVRRTPATLTVRIADQGNWRPEPTDPGTRGRGLRILRAVAEAMDIDSRPDGTTVTAHFALPVSPTPH